VSGAAQHMMRGWDVGDERTDSQLLLSYFLFQSNKDRPSSFSGLNTFSLWDRSRVERVELELELDTGWLAAGPWRAWRGVAWRSVAWHGVACVALGGGGKEM
jgi:hypothetical protein